MFCFDLVKYTNIGNPDYTITVSKYNIIMTDQEINELRDQCCPHLNNKVVLKNQTILKPKPFITSSKYPYPPKPNKKYKKIDLLGMEDYEL
jgi:hypothetical protein